MNFFKSCLLSLLLSATFIPQNSYSQIVRIPFAMGAAQVVAQTFEFGDVQVGQYVTTTFTYKNGSPLDLTILGTTSDNVDLIGSDCPTTLAAQDVCHITIGILVVDEGLNQGQVRIKNNQNVQEDVLNVTANGVTTGNILAINPAMQLYSIVNEEHEFTVTNNQVYDINIGNVLMSNNYWTISKNACTGTLTAGNSCKVTAKYVNKKTGGFTGILKVLSQSVMIGSANLSGNTALGVPSFSSDSISAQDLKVNEIYQNTVTLKNSGVGGMIINSVALDAATSSFSVTSNGCAGKTLAPNESCSLAFQIQFSEPDVLQRSLVFNLSNSSTSAAYLNIYASAVANTALLNPVPGSLTFGPQSKTATSAPLTLNLQSIGTSPVTVSDMYITGKDASLFSITNKASCLGSLSPEMQCPLTITYGPSNAIGTHTASIGFTTDATSPVNTVLLTGSSIAPTLSAAPSKVSFTGTIGTEQFQTVAITNTSSVETVLSSTSSDNSNIVTTGSSCLAGATLNAGESCSLKVTLKNTAPLGSTTGKITLNHSGDPLVIPVDVTLTAFKIDPIVSEISCPTVSRAVTSSGGTSPANAADYCSFTIKNPSASSVIYVATSGVSKVSGSALFSSSSSSLSSTLSIGPGITSTLKIPYQVPNSAGSYSADYSITSSTNLSIPANASTIQKTATVNVLNESYELSAIACPTSVTLGGSVNCTARLSNKSLSSYSLLLPYTPKNLVYAAAKFSETTLNGAAISSIIADRPVDDFSATTSNFKWTTSVTGCSAGSAASVGVANSGYCDLSIVFTPTKVGSYVVPLYGLWGVSTTNAFKGVSNALFSVVETVSGNLSNITCPRISVGANANCTATLSNPSSQTALAVSGVNLTPDASGTFTTATSNCGASLAPGATCTITIPAKGITAGNFTASLATVTSAGTYNATANITVDLATPSVSISAFSCPTVIENENTTCTTSIKNNGALAYNISAINLSKSNIGFGVATANSMNLAPGASATVSIPFVNSVAGTYTTNVTLSATGYTDLSTTATAVVNPAPAAVGTLSALSCSNLSFSQSGLCTATLKNTSTIKPLSVGTISVTGNSSIFGANSSTCGTSLAINASCTITIPVSGTSVGSYPVTLAVVTNPNLSQSSTVSVNALVFSVIAPPSTSTVAGSPVTLKSTFTNKNAFAVTIPVGAITLAGTGYKMAVNSCDNASLAPEQSCTVDVTYSGTVTGSYKGSLTLKYGGATVVSSLVAAVTTPTIGIAPLDGVVTKTSGFRSLSGTWYVVSNSNPVSLTISSISMSNTSSTAVALQSIPGSCYVSQTLQPNEQCLIFERYNLSSLNSTSATNTNTGTVKSTTNVSAAWSSSFITQKGNLTINKATASIAPTDTYTGVVTFTNLGVSPVKNILFKRTADSATGVFSLGSGNCAGVVAAGATCTQEFSIQGLAAGTTVVGVEVQGSYQTIVNDKLTQDFGEVTNIAVSPAKVTLTVSTPTGTLVTGSYGDGTSATSIFTNKSNFPVTVTAVDLTNATDQSLGSSTCLNAVVPAGGTCEITTTRQSQSGNLDFVRTPATLTVTVNTKYPFSGTIVSSPVLGNSINFGEVVFGSTSTKTVTIQNSTGSSIVFSSVTLPLNVTRVSSVAGDCPTTASFSLNAGSSCVMRVTWKPNTEGALFDQIKLVSNYGGRSTATVTTTGNAIIPVGTKIVPNVTSFCPVNMPLYDPVRKEIVTIAGTSLGASPASTKDGTTVNPGLYFAGHIENGLDMTNCRYLDVTPVGAVEPTLSYAGYFTTSNSDYTASQIGYVPSSETFVLLQLRQPPNTNGLNYTTPPIRHTLTFKQRGGVRRYLVSYDPFVKLGTYYSSMYIIPSYDHSVSYLRFYEGSTGLLQVYRINTSSVAGVDLLPATPFYSAGSEVATGTYTDPLKMLGAASFNMVDSTDKNLIWGQLVNYGIFTYNVQTGEIVRRVAAAGGANNVEYGIFATALTTRAMTSDGMMYGLSGNYTGYTLYSLNPVTKEYKTITNYPQKAWGLTNASISKVMVDSTQKYLIVVGNGYLEKVRIKP